MRDFDFSPDDGRITNLVIDALGIPALPVRLLGCSAVRIQMVQNITWNCITLSPGAEAYIQKLSTGLFDSAVNLLKVCGCAESCMCRVWQLHSMCKAYVKHVPCKGLAVLCCFCIHQLLPCFG